MILAIVGDAVSGSFKLYDHFDCLTTPQSKCVNVESAECPDLATKY